MDEIRLKLWHRVVGWMALAIEVPTRWWLGGAVALQRDAKRLRTLVERVNRGSSALGRGRWFVTDGLAAYVTVIKAVFREPVPTGQPGRPPLIPWPRLPIGPVVKRYVGGKLEGIERRLVPGSAEMIETLRHKAAGAGVLNTAFIERFNGTRRGHIAALSSSHPRLGRSLHQLALGYVPDRNGLQFLL